MVPELKAWEGSRMPGAPELVLVSSGSADELRAMGLRSTSLLDPDFVVGPIYGANGTPMGVLIDPHGMIASDLAVGADAVLALADAYASDGAAGLPVAAG
jgi:hypothetical protein